MARYHEIGRAVATIMSDEVFHDVAYKAKKREHLLAGMIIFQIFITQTSAHYRYILVAVTSSGIFKAKQKLAVTFNSDKHDVIDFTKFSKMTMCRASEAIS